MISTPTQQILCEWCGRPLGSHYVIARNETYVTIGFPGSTWHLVRTVSEFEDMLQGGSLPVAPEGTA